MPWPRQIRARGGGGIPLHLVDGALQVDSVLGRGATTARQFRLLAGELEVRVRPGDAWARHIVQQ